MSIYKHDNFSIKKYYINRIKKIYFPLIIVISITLILIKLIPAIELLNLKKETFSVIFGYNNFWQLSANLDYFARHNNSPFMHLWYIAILMQFELAFPIIYKFLIKLNEKINKHISTIIVFLSLIASTLLFYYMSKTQSIMTVYYNTFARSFSIIFGIFLALIHYKYNLRLSKPLKKYNTIIFTLYMLLLISLCIFVSADSKNYAIYMIIATIISTRLIEYSIKKLRKREKPNKFIINLANISYEIYLVQYPVIFFMQYIKINDFLKIPIIILLTIIISFLLNWLINLKLKNKLFKKLKIIIFTAIILFGSFILITEKDNTKEMKELENILNENLKVIEEKNNEYLNIEAKEKEELNSLIKNAENEESFVEEKVKKLNVVGIGDSVLLGAINGLYKNFPNGYFDGKVSRSIKAAEDVLKDLKNKGKLSDTLILALANNGDYSDKINKELMNIVENREIYWITAVKADDPKFNERFNEFAKNYTNIHIVDWEKASKSHPEYFYADGIHVKGDGIKAYADTIFDAICKIYLEKANNENREKIKKSEEEAKNKICFYGNDILTNSYSLLSKKFEKSIFNVKNDYDFNKLYNELNEKINNKTLEHKIIFLFDKKVDISQDEYKKIIDLCKNHEIYICKITDKKYDFKNSNVKIIDFNSEIHNNKDYLLSDKIHLSEKGNNALVDMLYNFIY